MTKDKPPEISPSEGDDYTKVTFEPDLKKFKMNELDDDIISLMSRRAYDIAGASGGVKVFLNGRQLPVSAIDCGCRRLVCVFFSARASRSTSSSTRRTTATTPAIRTRSSTRRSTRGGRLQ